MINNLVIFLYIFSVFVTNNKRGIITTASSSFSGNNEWFFKI